MTNINDTAFFAAEMAAEAAAQNTVDELYRRASAQATGSRAVALVAAVSIAAAATAAWRSPLGRKARNKIAAAIKAD